MNIELQPVAVPEGTETDHARRLGKIRSLAIDLADECQELIRAGHAEPWIVANEAKCRKLLDILDDMPRSTPPAPTAQDVMQACIAEARRHEAAHAQEAKCREGAERYGLLELAEAANCIASDLEYMQARLIEGKPLED